MNGKKFNGLVQNIVVELNNGGDRLIKLSLILYIHSENR
jgi:hypothetical protein